MGNSTITIKLPYHYLDWVQREQQIQLLLFFHKHQRQAFIKCTYWDHLFKIRRVHYSLLWKMLFAVQSTLPVKHILDLPRMAKTLINFYLEVCTKITSVTGFSDKGGLTQLLGTHHDSFTSTFTHVSTHTLHKRTKIRKIIKNV